MKPILGVTDFNNDLIYTGDKFSNLSLMNDEPIKVSNKMNKDDSVLITGLPHHTDYSSKSLSKMINDMQTWKKVRMIGSAAIASCYVASGKAERYQEKGVYLWDIIAGAAIVESAGGIADILNLRKIFRLMCFFKLKKLIFDKSFNLSTSISFILIRSATLLTNLSSSTSNLPSA